MFAYRMASAVFVGILILSLTACAPAGRTSINTPATSEPSLSEVATTGQADSPLAAPESPLPTPAAAAFTVATPSPGRAAVTGRLIHFSTGQPMVNQNLSLPSLLCPPDVKEEDKREECIYVIDEAFDPSELSDGEGRFVFQDIPAGDYVLLIGSQMTKYTVLASESNQPIIWKVEADKVFDLGDLVVDLR